MGQVIGAMAPGADVPGAEPIRLGNLTATLIHTRFDVGTPRLARGLPADLVRVVDGVPPIKQLF